MALAVVWRITRGGGGTAINELSKANEILTKRVHDLGAEVRDLKIENAELKMKTDYHAVMDTHEYRAEERHTTMVELINAQTSILSKIADRLGTDD